MASTSYNHTLSSSTSTSPPTSWDVFLSFSGKDTRHTFTNHLYNALHSNRIRTYEDGHELRGGEVISSALPQAIQESKTYIVVLSENYASSRWCLDELVEILTCHKTMQRLVIPVFYNIDPSVVRHQTGCFNEAFEKHQTRFEMEMERVNTWRHTLTEVADFSGHVVTKNSYEADIVNEVVKSVIREIKPRTLPVAKYPVGLDSRVKEIIEPLSSYTDGVFVIGIYGMSGVGKTTLAKALYNHLVQDSFNHSCFLANVREDSGAPNKGLVSLQKQLINDVLQSKNEVDIRNVDQGIELIRNKICSTKLLVVIDDVDDIKQYDSLVGPFTCGSVVIITTKDEEILDKIKVKRTFQYRVYELRYKVNELDDDDSLKLFIKHAFGDAEPDNTLMALSKDILCLADGLPMALEIFGAYLSSKSSVREWKYFIEKLQRAPDSNIQEKLKTSLDAIESDDPMLKKIFLDLACFFIGLKKKWVVNVLQTYCSYADVGIDILQKRCLLTIGYDDEYDERLGMHDLLRDMGREVARNNSPDEPEKHSRLWVKKDIDSVLSNHKGTESIQGIIRGNVYVYEFFETVQKKTFKPSWMPIMSTLGSPSIHKDEDENVETKDEDDEEYSKDEEEDENVETKDEDDEEYSEDETEGDEEDSRDDSDEEEDKNVETKDEDDEEYSKDEEEDENVETKDEDDEEYSEDETEGDEEDFRDDSDEVMEYSAKTFQRMSNLRFLFLNGINLTGSFEQTFENLRLLYWKSCPLNYLPSDFSPQELVMLELPKSNMITIWDKNKVPRVFKNLKTLNMRDSKCLITTPNFRKLPCLETLNLSGCERLTDIDKSIGSLASLVSLDLDYCENLRSLPDSICKLRSLKTLYISCCTSLERLPNLSNLKQLEMLSITRCSALTEILGLEELTSLKVLRLNECNSSLLTNTLTKPFFQILSRFGHRIQLNISAEFPDWIGQSSNTCSEVSLDLPPNGSHNFLAMIVCLSNGMALFEDIHYYVRNIASGLTWIDSYGALQYTESCMVIVPQSIFSIRDGDHKIELRTSEDMILGIHLLYETEITKMGEYESSGTVIVEEDERSPPSKRLKN